VVRLPVLSIENNANAAGAPSARAGAKNTCATWFMSRRSVDSAASQIEHLFRIARQRRCLHCLAGLMTGETSCRIHSDLDWFRSARAADCSLPGAPYRSCARRLPGGSLPRG
jgi:hypothetical protein